MVERRREKGKLGCRFLAVRMKFGGCVITGRGDESNAMQHDSAKCCQNWVKEDKIEILYRL